MWIQTGRVPTAPFPHYSGVPELTLQKLSAMLGRCPPQSPLPEHSLDAELQLVRRGRLLLGNICFAWAREKEASGKHHLYFRRKTNIKSLCTALSKALWLSDFSSEDNPVIATSSGELFSCEWCTCREITLLLKSSYVHRDAPSMPSLDD